MTPLNVPPEAASSEPIYRAAADLVAGDRIIAGFLPTTSFPATVVWADPYVLYGREWAFVVWEFPNGGRQGDGFLADALIPLEYSADAHGFSRDADDPTPVSPARVPLHTGGPVGTVSHSELVVDEPAPPPGVVRVAEGHVVPECCGKLDDGPHRNFCAAYTPTETGGQ